MTAVNSSYSIATPSASADISRSLSLDVQSVGNLRQTARTDNPAAIKKIAQQFEAMFLSMMLKNMRGTANESEMSSSNEMHTYRGMLDDQMSQELSRKRGIGLADMIVKQLSRKDLVNAADLPPASAKPIPVVHAATATGSATAAAAGTPEASAADFVNTMIDHARSAAESLGVTPRALVAQAALETGWGKHQIVDASGNNAHNLFGIKAGKDWSGKVASTTTTEYVNGAPQKRTETFRAYDSYKAGFDDYAKLIASKPRYANALNQGANVTGFANALQSGGYATDPAYADKISKVANHRVLREAAKAYGSAI